MENDLAALAGMSMALLAAGVGAGLLAGLLGIGGGIVIVPALFQLFTLLEVPEDVRMHLAVGTSLSTIVATSLSSARSHWRRGAVDPALLRSLGPAIVVGAIGGAALARITESDVLTGLFAVLALLMAAKLAFLPKELRLADALPGPVPRAGIGLGIGGLSTMLGIGGGVMTVPVLTLSGVDMHRAVGTAAAVGFLIALPGTLGMMILGPEVDPGGPLITVGYVSLLGFLVMTPSTVLAAPWGARLAHRIDGTLLGRLFAAFLLVTAARMAWSLL